MKNLCKWRISEMSFKCKKDRKQNEKEREKQFL